MTEKGWIIVALIAATAGCAMTGRNAAASCFVAGLLWVVWLL